MEDALKPLVRTGRACTVNPLVVTLSVTFAVPVILLLVLLYGPPGVLLVTFTLRVHEAWVLFMEAPVTVIVPLLGVAEITPVPDGQVEASPGDAATVTLAGSVSVKLMPVCDGLPVPLVNVNVSVEVPP